MFVCVSCAPDRQGGSQLELAERPATPGSHQRLLPGTYPLDSTVGTSIHYPTPRGFPEGGGERVGESVPTSSVDAEPLQESRGRRNSAPFRDPSSS